MIYLHQLQSLVKIKKKHENFRIYSISLQIKEFIFGIVLSQVLYNEMREPISIKRLKRVYRY